MLIVTQNEDPLDTRICNLIHNVGLFNEVKNLQSQQPNLQNQQPISSAFDKLQSDSATIANACEEWLNLLQSPDLEPYNDKVCHQFRQATCMTPGQPSTPRIQRQEVDLSHVNSAQEKLLQSSSDAVPDLLDFMTGSAALP